MGVDHGLGGKDNEKSKQRRAKRAARTKGVAMRALKGRGKKTEVVFDDDARVQWLTGFGKRKQERRKYGLAMEVLKKNKEDHETRKGKKAIIKEAKTVQIDEQIMDDMGMTTAEDLVSNAETTAIETTTVFDDENTVGMFGASVEVSIDDNIESFNANSYEEVSEDEEDQIRKEKVEKKKELTRFEKALKIAKSKMSSKPKRHMDKSREGVKNSKAFAKKTEGLNLLHKAIGSKRSQGGAKKSKFKNRKFK